MRSGKNELQIGSPHRSSYRGEGSQLHSRQTHIAFVAYVLCLMWRAILNECAQKGGQNFFNYVSDMFWMTNWTVYLLRMCPSILLKHVVLYNLTYRAIRTKDARIINDVSCIAHLSDKDIAIIIAIVSDSLEYDTYATNSWPIGLLKATLDLALYRRLRFSQSVLRIFSLALRRSLSDSENILYMSADELTMIIHISLEMQTPAHWELLEVACYIYRKRLGSEALDGANTPCIPRLQEHLLALVRLVADPEGDIAQRRAIIVAICALCTKTHGVCHELSNHEIEALQTLVHNYNEYETSINKRAISLPNEGYCSRMDFQQFMLRCNYNHLKM